MRSSRAIALSGVLSALAVVLLWIGALSGLGTYAAPLLAGVALTPVGRALGKKYHVLSFIAVSLLCCFLSADWEMNLMFASLFGWYPIVRPRLEKLRPPLRIIVKLAVFNIAAVGTELLVIRLIAPQSEESWVWIALLILGNFTFLIYDFALPRFEHVLARRLKLS